MDLAMDKATAKRVEGIRALGAACVLGHQL